MTADPNRIIDGVPDDHHREAFPYRHVHNPVFGADRPSCPVCGKATYSHGGVHPQCSAEREAKASDAALKASRKAVDEQVRQLEEQDVRGVEADLVPVPELASQVSPPKT